MSKDFGIQEVNQLSKVFERFWAKSVEYDAKTREMEVASAMNKIATQVAHDILSPLAALDVAAGDVTQLPEKKRLLIRNAVGRINEIANSLLDKNRIPTPQKDAAADKSLPSVQLLSSLIESMVSEKRLQYRSRSQVAIEVQFEAVSYGIFARVQPIEFKRLLSNLINNAVEALGSDPGSVRVTLSARQGRAVVSVQDDGKGILPEVMEKLGRRGETYGKVGGSGLGIYHARESAESWGGSLDIASEVGKGTTISVNLPQVPTLESFCSGLGDGAPKEWDAFLIDDDPLVRETWQVAAELAQKRLKVFTSADDFFQKASRLHRDTPIYIDATLGGNSRGEDESRRIHTMGFGEIYLATGQRADEFSAYVHLRGVVGKSPPWAS
jgi:anti-sigma regulatory factor (Ser/Thr protein kinase)